MMVLMVAPGMGYREGLDDAPDRLPGLGPEGHAHVTGNILGLQTGAIIRW